MIEFDCTECGQHIVRFNETPGELLLCGHCMFIPGWFRHADLRRMIAPEGLDNLPANERDQANDDT
jgi:hypothetical protein